MAETKDDKIAVDLKKALRKDSLLENASEEDLKKISNEIGEIINENESIQNNGIDPDEIASPSPAYVAPEKPISRPTTQKKPAVPEEELPKNNQNLENENITEKSPTQKPIPEKDQKPLRENISNQPGELSNPADAEESVQESEDYEPFSEEPFQGDSTAAGQTAEKDTGTQPDKKSETQADPESKEQTQAAGLKSQRQRSRYLNKLQDKKDKVKTKQKEEPKAGTINGFYSYLLIFFIRDVLLIILCFIPIVGAVVAMLTVHPLDILVIIFFLKSQDKASFYPFLAKIVASGSIYTLIFFLVSHSLFLIYLAVLYKVEGLKAKVTGKKTVAKKLLGSKEDRKKNSIANKMAAANAGGGAKPNA
ncbi:MAG: hypothetical protein GF349_03950 [Candidatus Magasanikbacteria bacterium]|nr:hypothetical protein [Candidatus Magasanikbacteria bacterium]